MIRFDSTAGFDPIEVFFSLPSRFSARCHLQQDRDATRQCGYVAARVDQVDFALHPTEGTVAVK